VSDNETDASRNPVGPVVPRPDAVELPDVSRPVPRPGTCETCCNYIVVEGWLPFCAEFDRLHPQEDDCDKWSETTQVSNRTLETPPPA
jgi:hypothetical protein